MTRAVTLGTGRVGPSQTPPGSTVVPVDAVRFDEVSLAYGRVLALDRVTLRLPAGSITAVMGPNGAGKSSLLAVAAGLVRPASGSVLVAGRSPRRSWTSTEVGMLSHQAMLYDALTAKENLALHARLRGLPASRVDEVLAWSELDGTAHRLVGTVSHGVRRRLSLARVLLHDPPLLLLDEPFTGLDPDAQARLASLLDGVRGVKTVLFSTHDLDRALAQADRVLLLDRGRLVSEDEEPTPPGERGEGMPEGSAERSLRSPPTSVDAPNRRDDGGLAAPTAPAGVVRTARSVFGKDLRVEYRTRAVSSAVLVLSGLLAMVLAMALEPWAGSPRVASGILWVLVVFAALHALVRGFDEDLRDGALQGLLLTGAEPAGVYLGRVASATVSLLVVSAAGVGAVAVLFAAPPPVGILPGLTVVMALAVTGLAAVGSILTVLTRHAALGETLLPLLFLPLAIPVLLAGVESVTVLLETGAVDPGWLRVLALYVIGMTAAGMMMFEHAVEG